MSDVMISYSRRNADFVKQLHAQLTSEGKDVWVDWEDIPLNADWWDEICRAIESSDTVIFVLSPDSISSPICQLELAHAEQNHKRLIPVVRVDTDPEESHKRLLSKKLDDNMHKALAGRSMQELSAENWNLVARLNWIFIRESDSFDTAYPALVNAIDTDLDHVRQHTRLTVRATEWADKDKNISFLLEGVEIQEAEAWLTQGMKKNPMPSEMQAEYISLSRQRAVAQQRRLLVGVSIGFLVAVGLGVLSFFLFLEGNRQRTIAEDNLILAQTNEAQAISAEATALHNALEAQSLALSTSAQLALVDNDTDLALALALVASQIEPLAQVQQTLADAAYTPGTVTEYRNIGTQTTETSLGVAFNDDGTLGLSNTMENLIVLWDVSTGEVIREFDTPIENLRRASFSVDGSLAVSGASDGTLQIWDVETGELLHMLDGHNGTVNAVAFSPDGTQIISGGSDRDVCLWDVQTGELLLILEANEDDPLQGTIQSVAMSPDGTQAVSGGANSEIVIWDVEVGVEMMRLSEDNTGSVMTVAYSPDGEYILSGGSTGGDILQLWDAETGELQQNFVGHGGVIYQAVFDSHDNMIISSSQDTTVRLWTYDGIEVQRFTGHSRGVTSVAFSMNGQRALSADMNQTVRVWGLVSGAELAHLDGHTAAAYVATISPDGAYYLSGGADRLMYLWDAETGEILRTFEEQADAVWGVDFSPNGQLALMGVRDGTASLWDVETGDLVHQFPVDPDGITGHSARVWDVNFSPDGTTALTAGGDGTIREWDVETGELLRTFESHEGQVRAVVYSPDGTQFASGGSDSTVTIWDIASSERIFSLTEHGDWLWDIAYSANGQYIASGSSDGMFIVWDASTGELIHQIVEQSITGVAFNPDSTLVATASADGTVRQWDIVTGAELRRYTGHQSGVWSVEFTPDGQGLLSASGDNTLILWRTYIPLDELITWTQANRYLRDLTDEERETYRLYDVDGA